MSFRVVVMYLNEPTSIGMACHVLMKRPNASNECFKKIGVGPCCPFYPVCYVLRLSVIYAIVIYM